MEGKYCKIIKKEDGNSIIAPKDEKYKGLIYESTILKKTSLEKQQQIINNYDKWYVRFTKSYIKNEK